MAEAFLSDYRLIRSIGSSHFSRVYHSTDIVNGKECAIKVLCKLQTYESDDNPSLLNADLFKSNDLLCPHLVSINNMFQDLYMIVISMEYVSGDTLFSWLLKNEAYSEAGVSIIIHHILVGLQVLHTHGIVHRDLKPENLLVAQTSDGNLVKITDYCLAPAIDSIEQLTNLSMNEICTAPELLFHKSYDFSADLWSVGIIAYMILIGERPFNDDQGTPLSDRVRNPPRYDQPQWQEISPHAKDFIQKLLRINPKERMTAAQALNHPWIQSSNDDKPLVNSYKAFQLTAMGRQLYQTVGAAQSAPTFRQITRLTREAE